MDVPIIFLFVCFPPPPAPRSRCAFVKGVESAANLGWIFALRQDDGQGVGGDFIHRYGAATGYAIETGTRRSANEGLFLTTATAGV